MSDLPRPSTWWQRAVVYQIYPRSFAAGQEGSGVGDLAGITEHLEHIAWLGADTIWLSPVFRSPMADFGYDVSDYCDVDPVFGSIDDLDRLVAEAHRRGMKVLLDWVPNHTSDEHPWFVESRSSRANPRADWYIWRDEPANNWNAAFPKGEPAWQHDPVRDQWYLRTFARQQPDLNWDLPEVEAAMHDTLRFWLDRGVDGFRMDVVHLIGKDVDRDDPADAVARGWPHVPYNDVPVTHERLRRIRAVLDEYPGDRTSVGEVYLLDEAAVARYHGDGDELHMSFNFPFLWARADASSLRERITRSLEHLAPIGAWPTWVLSNHDVPRHRQRHGGDERVARMMCLVLLTLPGTPFLYQGEELGLVDADVPPEQQVDPGRRDGCRAPIPWTGEPLHGWPAVPWLPFPPEADRRNVAAMRDDPSSIMHLYRDAIALRRGEDGLIGGNVEALDLGETVLAHRRGDGWVVVANFGEVPVELDAPLSVALSSTRTLDGHTVSSVPPLTAVVARSA